MSTVDADRLSDYKRTLREKTAALERAYDGSDRTAAEERRVRELERETEDLEWRVAMIEDPAEAEAQGVRIVRRAPKVLGRRRVARRRRRRAGRRRR